MVRSGFYNSKNHDRLYYNSDMSRLFNSLIKDGVFQNIGDKFIARPGTGMQVIIPSGMAYFNSTWIFNDTDYVQAIDAAPIVAGFSRIDGIFLKMGPVDDQNERLNSIYYMAGTPASQDAQRPVPTVVDGEVYVPICYVTVATDTTSITAAMITNMVGTSSCPFITGILETIDATELLTQWEAQWNDWLNAEKTDFEAWTEDRQTAFTEWFETIKGVLDSDAAGHLQNEINELQQLSESNINMLGAKNILPNNGTSTTINGVTFTVFEDGTMVLNGTATADTNFNLVSKDSGATIADIFSEAGRYKIVTNLIESTQAMVFIGCWHDNNWVSPNVWVGTARATSAVKSFDITKAQIDGGTEYGLTVLVKVFEGEVYNNERVVIMITPESLSDETYTSYAPSNRILYKKINQINDDLAPLKKGAGYVANKDLNTLTEAGTYLCLTNCTNLPNTTEWFTVNVFAGGTGSFIQQAIGATSNTMYYRHNDGNGWSNWRRNFNFGIDSNGNYGYIKDGADTVTPFKRLEKIYSDKTQEVWSQWKRTENINISSLLPDIYQSLTKDDFLVVPTGIRSYFTASHATSGEANAQITWTYNSTTGILTINKGGSWAIGSDFNNYTWVNMFDIYLI